MSEWISVEDWLPELNAETMCSDHVLICYQFDGQSIIDIGEVQDTFRGYRWAVSNGDDTVTATHWMPLPDHPTQEGE